MLVGVLGGGQLGRMLALAGARFGWRFRFLDVDVHVPAGHVGELLHAPDAFTNAALLERFARGCDVVTFEFENVPSAAAAALARFVPLHPGVNALEISQDRLSEKRLFERIGLPVPAYAAVSTHAELQAAAVRLGLPLVLKTRRMGYDGKGQAVLRSSDDVAGAWGLLGAAPGGLIVERLVAFEREVSAIGVRARDGACRVYPLSENVHRAGMLRVSRAPARVPASLASAARAHIERILHETQYVGVLALELFVVPAPDGSSTLLGNEIAPRVHNSGHWTIDAPLTSQFENHLRAIAGLPLGDTELPPGVIGGMVNLIGTPPPLDTLARVPGARVHLYAKASRPGRKVGHVNICGSETDVTRAIDALRALSEGDVEAG